jgi:hypothetical protein
MKTALIALLVLAALAGCAQRERRGPCLATDAQCISEFKEKEASDKAARRAREIRAQETDQASAKASRAKMVREVEEQADRELAKQGAEEEANFNAALADRKKQLAGKKQDPNNTCHELWKVKGEFMEMPCDPSKRSQFEIDYERDMAAKQKKCGKDFQQLRVGMTLGRFEQCNESLSFVTESFTQGGVVETYRSSFYWINARNGRVVSYTRRTR